MKTAKETRHCNVDYNVPDRYRALKAAGVPTELHIFAAVGHGFGLRASNSRSAAGWIERFRAVTN
jgi:acetyl esterase/lipase